MSYSDLLSDGVWMECSGQDKWPDSLQISRLIIIHNHLQGVNTKLLLFSERAKFPFQESRQCWLTSLMNLWLTAVQVIVVVRQASNSPQAPDKFNPKVNPQTCGIIHVVFWRKQGLESTKRKMVKIKKNCKLMLVIYHMWHLYFF